MFLCYGKPRGILPLTSLKRDSSKLGALEGTGLRCKLLEKTKFKKKLSN